MSNWNGEERRKGNDRRDDDHDLLIQIHSMLTSLEKNYNKHVEDDDGHFGRLYRGQAKLAWLVGIGVGGIAVLKFFVK